MKSHLLYTVITLSMFAGIGMLISGLSKLSGKGNETPARPRSEGGLTLFLGLVLLAGGSLLLYFFNEQLENWLY